MSLLRGEIMDEFERFFKKYECVDKDGRFEREEDEEEIIFIVFGE